MHRITRYTTHALYSDPNPTTFKTAQVRLSQAKSGQVMLGLITLCYAGQVRLCYVWLCQVKLGQALRIPKFEALNMGESVQITSHSSQLFTMVTGSNASVSQHSPAEQLNLCIHLLCFENLSPLGPYLDQQNNDTTTNTATTPAVNKIN